MSKLNLSWQSFLVLMGLGVSLHPAIAVIPLPVETKTAASSQLMANLSLPETDRGQPDSSTGGGKRGGDERGYFCVTAGNKSLFRPILPVEAEGTVETKTAKAETTFWWHIPENDAIRGEFTLFTADQPQIHTQAIEAINEVEGLLAVTLPADILSVGEKYYWEFMLVCDESFDVSGNPALYGEIERADVTQLQISSEPTAISALVEVLRGQDSYLSLDPAEAQSLAAALDNNADEATVQMVSGRLLWHFKTVADAYAEEGETMTAAENVTKKLELAQLSAFFGLWSDTVNLIASERESVPESWESLLEAIFPADNPSTVKQEDEIIDLLSVTES